jgi:DNA-binding protein YbaB
MLGKLKELYKLQKQAKSIQKELKKMVFSETKAGITATVNGSMEVVSFEFDEGAKEALSDAGIAKVLTEIVNDALKKAQKKAAKNMSEITGQMFPGM